MKKLVTTAHLQNISWNKIKLNAFTNLPTFVFIILALLLLQTFAELSRHFFAPVDAPVPADIKNNVVAVKKVAANNSLEKVATYHLFGDAKQQSVIQQKVIDAPDTRLHLILKGVFAASNSKNAMAIIATKNGDDKNYHIGDKLDGGALLHAIYADRVILKRNGNLETLRLPKASTKNLYNKSAAPYVVSPNTLATANKYYTSYSLDVISRTA